MNKSKKTLAVFALGALIFAVTACNNPFFPKEKEREGNSDGSYATKGTDNNLAVAIAADIDGVDVTLTAIVTGSGDGTLSYQWYANGEIESSEGGTRLYGETEETYEPPTDIPGTTYYYVEVTNIVNGQTAKAVSNTVGVVVREEGEEGYDDEPIGIIVSEPVDTPVVTIAAESAGGKVTLTAFTSISDEGTLSYQWYRSAVDRSDEGAALSGATDAAFMPPTSPNGTVYYYVKATNTLRGQAVSAASHTVKIVVQGGKIVIEEIVVSDTVETPTVSVTPINNGVTVTLTAAASVSDGGTLSYRWYKNTADNSGSKGGTPIAGATRPDYTPPNIDGTAYYYIKVTNTLKGQTADSVSNTVKIVVQNGNVAVEQIVVSATVEIPEVRVTAANNGSSVTLTASASVNDGGTLVYQWYRNTVDNSKNGALVADETGKTYTPPPAEAYYYVKVTNSLKGQTAEAVSNTVRIVIRQNGEITFIESDTVKTPTVTITAAVTGKNVTIMAGASVGDRGTLSYQWYYNTEESRNGTLIAGATGNIYAPPTASPGTTYYYVKVTNTLKGQTAVATSNIVGVVVPKEGGFVEIIEVEIPRVTIASSVSGSTVTLTATASVSDGGSLSYQWFSNDQNNKSGTLISGAIGTSYTPPTAAAGTTFYYVRVTNTLQGKTATATSNIIRVTVPQGSGSIEVVEVETSEAETPRVTIAAAVEGATVTITATASVGDGGTLAYQWFSNTLNNKPGTEIADATGAAYTPLTNAVGTTYYYVRVTNTLIGQTASATSNIVGVVVPQGGLVEVIEVEAPQVSIIASMAAPFVIGSNVVLTASATVSDGGYLSYQWYSSAENNTSGEAIEGATGLMYTAPTEVGGTTYYYVRATNTLQGKIAGAFSNILQIAVVGWEIDSVEVSVIAPVMSQPPNQQAFTTETGYTPGPVTWTTGGTAVSGTFLGNTIYTATVTLTAQAGFTFAETFTGKINGRANTDASNKTETSVTLSHTFVATLNKTATSVTVVKQPDKMTYHHGEALNLDGMKITVNYSDDSKDEEKTLAELAETTNITTEPVEGEKLRRSTAIQTVRITVGGGSTNTQALTITPKELKITGLTHTKPYDGNTAANPVNITLAQFEGVEFGENVTGITGVTFVYTSANAGTVTADITGGGTNGTVVGGSALNYVVGSATNVTVTGGITKTNPRTVTGPTGLTGTYGNALSTISLTVNNGTALGVNNETLTGTFTWTTPTNLVGDAGPRTPGVTFTPASTGVSGNYNPGTGNANITVTGKPVTLTVGEVSRTLSPVDTTATFTVSVNGLLDNHNVTVNLASNSYGVTLSNNTGVTNAGKSLTLTYDDTTVTQATALSIGLTITVASTNDYYTPSGSPTVAPTVNDGRIATRAIPVTQQNIVRASTGFNTYANTTEGLKRHYKLAQNVTLTAPAAGQSNWTPIGSGNMGATTNFQGTFDGQGYTITNLTINADVASDTNTGMFGMVGSYSGGVEIKNLGLKGVNIVSNAGSVGGLAGTLYFNSTIRNCFVTGSVTASGPSGNVGGVVGRNNYNNNNAPRVENCYSAATVKAYTGTNNTVSGFTSAGGVVGNNSGIVQYCYSTGSVSNDNRPATASYTQYASGVVGNNNATSTNAILKNCVALNSSITVNYTTEAWIRRVYTGSGSSSHNYGKSGITMTRSASTSGTSTTPYTPTSSASGNDGETLVTTANNVKNPNVVTFWTTAGNWDTAAWNTTIWDTSTVTSEGRPILRGFTAGMQ